MRSGADADVQLGGDLGAGAALGDQLPFPGAELPRLWRCGLLRRSWVGKHEGVLDRGGSAHHRAAFLSSVCPGQTRALAKPRTAVRADGADPQVALYPQGSPVEPSR